MELIGPARDGALAVLTAAREAGVRRVVMTSSEAAIAGSRSDTPHRVYTEDDWTDLDAPGVSAYNQSKTIAERAARDDVEAHGGPEFATVNPGLVLGPVARPEVNASVEVVSAAVVVVEPPSTTVTSTGGDGITSCWPGAMLLTSTMPLASARAWIDTSNEPAMPDSVSPGWTT